MNGRQFGLGVGITILALGLTGCWADPVPPPANWQARLLDRDLQIAACEAMVGDEIGADRRNESGEKWTEFWAASGAIDVSAGEVLTAGAEVDGLQTQLYQPDLIGVRSAFIVFLTHDGSVERASFVIDPEVPSGYWIATDGTASREPCQD